MDLARKAGFEQAHRAYQAPQHDGDVGGIPGAYIEVRRRERLQIADWTKEVEAKAGSRLPVVAYRRSNEAWHAVVPLDALLELLRRAHEARS